MRHFWRKQPNNGEQEKRIKESEERLKRTEEQWEEIHKASRRLEQWLQDALRGGPA